MEKKKKRPDTVSAVVGAERLGEGTNVTRLFECVGGEIEERAYTLHDYLNVLARLLEREGKQHVRVRVCWISGLTSPVTIGHVTRLFECVCHTVHA